MSLLFLGMFFIPNVPQVGAATMTDLTSPIIINDDSEFQHYIDQGIITGSGNTDTDPYIIQNYAFDQAQVGNIAIRIQHTTKFFTIQHCTFTGNNVMQAIELRDNGLSTAKVYDNTFDHLSLLYGIISWANTGVKIDSNSFDYSAGVSIYIAENGNLTAISNNAFIGGGKAAVVIDSGNINGISNNLFQEFAGDIAIDISGTGILNLIGPNTFIDSDATGSLVKDDSTTNVNKDYWNGNYYSNYDNSGTYQIGGSAGLVDTNPKTTPPVASETGTIVPNTHTVPSDPGIPFSTSGFIIAIVLASLYSIRLKSRKQR